MDNIVNYAIPMLLILIMLIIGAEITVTNIRQTLKNPKLLIQASILQIIILFAISLLIIYIFNPEVTIISGIVLIAACPGGALSNYYTYLAKGDVAFSVSLTILSTLLSFITLPIFIDISFSILLDRSSIIAVPVTQLIGQLFFLLLIPVCFGILIRYFFNNWYQAYHIIFQRISLIALLALILFISWDQTDYLSEQIYSILLLAIVFNLSILLAGFGVVFFMPMDKKQRIAFLFELPVKNLGIAYERK